MIRRLLVATASASGLALAACGSGGGSTPASSPGSPSPSPTPTPAASGSGSSMSGAGNVSFTAGMTGGYGDTSANPDTTYACGFNAVAGGGTTVVAYVTVAGGNSQDTQMMCSALQSDSPTFQSESSLRVPESSAACHLTTADGGATARIYGATSNSDTTTQAICSAMLSSAGVSSTSPSAGGSGGGLNVASGATGGYGDTAANPDSSDACGFEALSGGSVVAYVSVAGSNSADTQAMCSSLGSDSTAFRQETTLTVPESSAACYVTTADGGATARVYGVSSNSDPTTQTICASMLTSAGVSG